MPLKKGKTHKAFDYNFHLLLKEGKPIKQALAIAYAVLSKTSKKKSKK